MAKRKTNKLVPALIACVVVASGLLALFNETLGADPAPATTTTTGDAGKTLEGLEALEVKGRAPKTGYDRTVQFGAAWTDVDRNDCDTRNDILARDLSDLNLSGTCKVLSGRLKDPYTGTTVEFVRGQQTSSVVQIDHVVALSDAWQKGAQQLTQDQRIAFANDPRNLLAVSGKANAQKGDGDVATWLPENKAFRCEYVSRQISVKVAYKLWVTAAEKAAMISELSACP